MADNDLTRFPSECPRCATTTGFPYRVQTDPANHHRVHIDLRCRQCHNEWHVERTAPPFSSGDAEAAQARSSAIQHRASPAIAADRPDFLDPSLAWTPSQRFGHGQVYEYRLALGASDVAILQLVPGKGWAMTIAHGTAPSDERGLFATPRDALMVLLAEFASGDDDSEDLPTHSLRSAERAEA